MSRSVFPRPSMACHPLPHVNPHNCTYSIRQNRPQQLSEAEVYTRTRPSATKASPKRRLRFHRSPHGEFAEERHCRHDRYT
ncbi:hypothetical protein NITHO_1920002 [Nitrolancea hollandica Lb]|uniref:Uncharacterized protein n=1 Tax=Nitrolancea hollandica Lb TaxID=1129897 RepID=I4EEM9_9BACT|nr:hypothetical protein NITHO_1920002 [Nitrolancea hollandica Lb]